MEEEDANYGDILDEDFIEALSQPSQASQTLPPLNAKRRRSRDSIESCGSEDEEGSNARIKKSKYIVHITDRDVPAARILGATQAEELPDSSPYRIRGPIYKKPRPEPEAALEPPEIRPLNAPRQPLACRNDAVQRREKPVVPVIDLDQDFGLGDLPSDAFSSPDRDTFERPVTIGTSVGSTQAHSFPSQRLVAPQHGLCQTTLFGGKVNTDNNHNISASQAKKVRNYKIDQPPEAPTHHALDEEALRTWVYPMNLGTIRDYQYSIVRNGLFNNLLVALPTGLFLFLISASFTDSTNAWGRLALPRR
jgi:ATP-dependent DNA helicase MPH1